MVLESGTRMAVKPGCFAIRRDQNLSPVQISNFLRVRLQKQPDAWPEGVPLPLAFDCYATKVFCPPWYWNRGPGWLSSQGSSQGVLQGQSTLSFTSVEFRVVLYLIDSKCLGVSATLPEFYAYAAPVGKTLRSTEMPGGQVTTLCPKGVLSSMVFESGTRMAVKPGCFAIRRDQNLSPVQISYFLRVPLQKQPDAWSEGVPLPLAFDCYPNQQRFEGATPETT